MVSRGRAFRAGQLLRVALVVVVALGCLAYSPSTPIASAVSSCPAGTGYGGERTSSADRSISNGGNGCLLIVHSGGTEVFTHTGALQKWTVPAGITSVTLHLIGAGGGAALIGRGGSSGGNGGGGGYSTGTLTVAPGDVYDVTVGGGGRYMCVSDAPENLTLTQRRNFSFGGGAAGYGGAAWDCSWASGGGRTALRVENGTDDIITAGGGGGGGHWNGHGGAGGGTTGQDGNESSKGKGGTQSAGGAAGLVEDGYPGVQYAGGPAGLNTASASEGGGGGGGYYGGGGAGNNSGGGGGSSYVGSARGLQSGSTQAGSWRTPGAVAPSNSAVPTISGTAKVGSTLTATTGTWTGATSTSFKWQSSPNNSTWTDIPGATGATYVIGLTGYFRAVETATNFFGDTSANSTATTLVYDTTLSALSVSTGSLAPAFASDTFAYTVSVPYTTTSIRLTASRNHVSTTLTVDGAAVTSGVASPAVALSVGANVIPVVATNTGVSTTTTITVTRAAATAPTAPSITSVTAGDRFLTVAFTSPADDGGEPVTDYEYSLNGAAWVSMGGISSPFRIGSLTNGTTYSVRVRAKSTVGGGAPSTAVNATPSAPATTTVAPTSTVTTTTTDTAFSATTTPSADVTVTGPTTAPRQSAATPTTTAVRSVSAPTTTTTTTSTTTVPSRPADDVPSLEPGEAYVLRDGSVGRFELSRSGNMVSVSSGGSAATLVVRDAQGNVVPLDESGSIWLRDGTCVVGMEVNGFRPDTDVETWLYSDPTRLGTATVNTSGSATGAYPAPPNVTAGRHRLVLAGTDAGGSTLVIALDVKVGTSTVGSRVGSTLFAIVLLMAVGAGIFFPAVARRRRRENDSVS